MHEPTEMGMEWGWEKMGMGLIFTTMSLYTGHKLTEQIISFAVDCRRVRSSSSSANANVCCDSVVLTRLYTVSADLAVVLLLPLLLTTATIM